MADYPWPPLPDGRRPVWTGSHFKLEGGDAAVLAYTSNDSGWSDDLTLMHEDVAGGHHPIDELSRRWALTSLRRSLPHAEGVFLEVGCSSGFLVTELQRQHPGSLVIGSDFLLAPLERLASRLPGVPLVQFDARHCPLPTASLDGVVLLNVLEHIDDDAAAMRQMARILKPGGVAVIEVPAGPHLFDVYDEHLQHYRRYTRRGLLDLAAAAGLRPIRSSHLGFFVYPAFAAVKRWRRRMAWRDPSLKRRIVEQSIAATDSRLVRWLLHGEMWVGDWLSMPIGIRCVAVFRK